MRSPIQKVGKCSSCKVKDRMVTQMKSVQLCSQCMDRYLDKLR